MFRFHLLSLGLSLFLSSNALSAARVTCSPATLAGSSVVNNFTTPAQMHLKKAFVQRMNHDCILTWPDRETPMDLSLAPRDLVVRVLEYQAHQITVPATLEAPAGGAIEFWALSETPAGEKWRFRMKNRVRIVIASDFFDVQGEAASNNAFGTSLVPLPGGSPGADRVKYISFRIRADRMSSNQLRVRFETLSALDISGFAAGLAFKLLQNGSNQDALKKFDAATELRAQHFGRTL